MALPTGTITFLFTDIEGSTRRWEQNAQAMRQALAAHDTIMRGAISANSGHVFKTIGDAFCAAFGRAEHAIAACLAAQSQLKSINIPEIGQIRVRMALHTGEADERDGDYFGPALNRVARLQAIGHGEQVLVSSATQSMVQRWLSDGTTLRDLGTHQLKDLAEPERVYQLSHPDLRTDFPALKSQESRPNNLPRQLTTFVGRDKEIAQLKELLSGASMLTLTGSGGCGKTRLALKLGHELLTEFSDGVWFIELASLSDPQLLPQPLIKAMGIRESPGKSLVQTVIEHLGHRHVLLIADNCEHVLDAAAELIGEILQRCPEVRVIATSREALRVDGEVSYRVPSLSVPAAGPAKPAADYMKCEAIALFVLRAKAAKPNFTLTDATAPAVASICRRLDGIPLAIELAAARIKVLSAEQINARLDDRFRLLTSGSRSGLERHQTLRAAIAWSYGLLTDEEKRVLRTLSAFAGGWSLEAGVAVSRDEDGKPMDEFVVLDLLSHLVDKSLVVMDEEQGDSARYRLLDTVKQFAVEEATTAGDLAAARDRHLEHFLHFAEAEEKQLLAGNQARCLAQLSDEHDNLLAAIQWSQGKPETAEDGLRVAGAIWRFWETRAHWTVGAATLAQLLEAVAAQAPTPRPQLAKAYTGAGVLAWHQGNYPRAEEQMRMGLEISRQLGDDAAMGDSLNNLGLLATDRGDLAVARDMHNQALQLRIKIDNRRGIAASRNNLGWAAMQQGDWSDARPHLEDALAISRALGNKTFVAAILGNLAVVMLNLSDFVAARKLFNEALAISRELGHRGYEASSIAGLGDVCRLEGALDEAKSFYEHAVGICREIGEQLAAAIEIADLVLVAQLQRDHPLARQLLREVLSIASELGSKPVVAKALQVVAQFAAEVGPSHAPTVARLLGAADAVRQAIPKRLDEIDRPDHDRAVQAAEKAIGKERFTELWNEGAAMIAQDPTGASGVRAASAWLASGG